MTDEKKKKKKEHLFYDHMEEINFSMSFIVLFSAIGKMQILCNMLILLSQMSYNIIRAICYSLLHLHSVIQYIDAFLSLKRQYLFPFFFFFVI